jgi:hypothetical protein
MKKYTKQSNARRTLKNKKRSYQQKLQLFNGGDGDDDSGHNECGLCYEGMNGSDSILLHPPANEDQRPHKFHKECIAPMLETNAFDHPDDPASIKCPYCEFAVKKAELRRQIGFNVIKYTVNNVRDFIHWLRNNPGKVAFGVAMLANVSVLLRLRNNPLVPHRGGEQHLSEKEKEKEKEKENISKFREKFVFEPNKYTDKVVFEPNKNMEEFLFVPKKYMKEFIQNCEKNKNKLEEAFEKDGPITIMYRSTESKSLSKSSRSRSRSGSISSKTKRLVSKKSKSNKNGILSSNSI